jgi:hypothetical protein
VTQTYITFIDRLRALYPSAPIFLISAFGFPTPQGLIEYFQAEDTATLNGVKGKDVHLVNGTGWVQYGDTFPEYVPLPVPNF